MWQSHAVVNSAAARIWASSNVHSSIISSLPHLQPTPLSSSLITTPLEVLFLYGRPAIYCAWTAVIQWLSGLLSKPKALYLILTVDELTKELCLIRPFALCIGDHVKLSARVVIIASVIMDVGGSNLYCMCSKTWR
ncbi:hypothetical protein EVAR_6001_1 [Eumeta japonica]|uniref:Uncharacterized protein n=1 Tax=Eumeta variegata TaxID=151549 RepID=A0A4C1T9I0_EUMVA|nr:hypothetical protein EVAR_6001_1 [Eumeta japonica]